MFDGNDIVVVEGDEGSGKTVLATQPMPLPGSTPAGIGQALASTRHKWVLVLDLYALARAVI
jgi:archaellum biogenesis ATPase FlaH